MALPIAIIITLLIGYITFFINKKLSFIHNSIVFMIMMIITKNYTTIMTLNLKLLKSSEDPLLFLYLTIDKGIITPLLIILYLNLRLPMKTWSKKISFFIITISAMQVLDVLMIYFGVIEFIKWNMFYTLLVNVGIIIIGLGVSKFLLFIAEQKGQKYDSYL